MKAEILHIWVYPKEHIKLKMNSQAKERNQIHIISSMQRTYIQYCDRGFTPWERLSSNTSGYSES